MQLKSSLLPALLAGLATANVTSSAPEIQESSPPLVVTQPAVPTVPSISQPTGSNPIHATTSSTPDSTNTHSDKASASASGDSSTGTPPVTRVSSNIVISNSNATATSTSSASSTSESSEPTSKGHNGNLRTTVTSIRPGSTPTSINAAGRSQLGLAVLGLALAAGLGL